MLWKALINFLPETVTSEEGEVKHKEIPWQLDLWTWGEARS